MSHKKGTLSGRKAKVSRVIFLNLSFLHTTAIHTSIILLWKGCLFVVLIYQPANSSLSSFQTASSLYCVHFVLRRRSSECISYRALLTVHVLRGLQGNLCTSETQVGSVLRLEYGG